MIVKKKDPDIGEKAFLTADKMWAIQFDTIRNCQQNDVDPFNSDLCRNGLTGREIKKKIKNSPHESSARVGKLFH